MKVNVCYFMFSLFDAKRLSCGINDSRKKRNLQCSIYVSKDSRRTLTWMNNSIDIPPLHSSTDCLKTCTRNSFCSIQCHSHLYCSYCIFLALAQQDPNLDHQYCVRKLLKRNNLNKTSKIIMLSSKTYNTYPFNTRVIKLNARTSEGCNVFYP